MRSAICTCPVWGTDYKATGYTVADPSKVVVEHSDRAGGGYVIPASVARSIGSLDVQYKARLTTWLIDQRMQGVEQPEITEAPIASVKSRPPLAAHLRAERLLRFLVDGMTAVSGEISLNDGTFSAYAYSESTRYADVLYFLSYLEDQGWVKVRQYAGDCDVAITVAGYRRIEEQTSGIDSSQAFVAMWFHDSMKGALAHGMEPAIRDAGYKPFRIDQKEHINKIDDEIIAEIRRSRFLVADFTHGDDGARGGVYYEAGFAHGLGLPVIFTCHKDWVETLHFDTNHYNHIVWITMADLREKLKNRILAVIGEGPEDQTTS